MCGNCILEVTQDLGVDEIVRRGRDHGLNRVYFSRDTEGEGKNTSGRSERSAPLNS